MAKIKRRCLVCSRLFATTRQDRLYCSPKCRLGCSAAKVAVQQQRETVERKTKQSEKVAKNCSACGETFYCAHGLAKYCSPKCRTPWRARSQRLPGGLITGNTGAASELLVCADLIFRSVHVFRSVSPASPCDLVIQRDGKLLRVEVTKGKRLSSGKLGWAPHEASKYDVLALVFDDRSIVYIPDIFAVIAEEISA